MVLVGGGVGGGGEGRVALHNRFSTQGNTYIYTTTYLVKFEEDRIIMHILPLHGRGTKVVIKDPQL